MYQIVRDDRPARESSSHGEQSQFLLSDRTPPSVIRNTTIAHAPRVRVARRGASMVSSCVRVVGRA